MRPQTEEPSPSRAGPGRRGVLAAGGSAWAPPVRGRALDAPSHSRGNAVLLRPAAALPPASLAACPRALPFRLCCRANATRRRLDPGKRAAQAEARATLRLAGRAGARSRGRGPPPAWGRGLEWSHPGTRRGRPPARHPPWRLLDSACLGPTSCARAEGGRLFRRHHTEEPAGSWKSSKGGKPAIGWGPPSGVPHS